MSYEDVAAQWRSEDDREARAADYRDHQERRRARVVEDAQREEGDDGEPFEPCELHQAKKIAKGLWTVADKVVGRFFGEKAKLRPDEQLELVDATAPVVQLYVPRNPFGVSISPWWGLAIAVGSVYGMKWLDKDDPPKPTAAKPPAPAEQTVDGKVMSSSSSEGQARAA